MKKVNKTTYSTKDLVSNNITADEVQSVPRETLDSIQSMSESPEWEKALKELHKKYK